MERPSAPSTMERLLADPAKAPRMFERCDEFVDALIAGKHVDEICVLRDGVRKLGLAGSIRRDVLSAVQHSSTIPEWAERLGARALDELDGRVYYWDEGRERTLKRDRDGNLHRSVCEKLCAASELADENAAPAPTPAEGAQAGGRATGGLYIAELSHRRLRPHPCSLGGERSRTLSARDVQDVLPGGVGRVLPSWDRGHAFLGGAGTGSSVHVDQVCWSNVGKNYTGHKVLAIWPLGAETHRILDRWYRFLLPRPDPLTGELSEDAAADLATASRVALVGPGDVFVFSGANAHTTLVVPTRTGEGGQRSARPRLRARSAGGAAGGGVPGCLNLTSYESFVNFNLDNLKALLNTGTHLHHESCTMRPDDLADLKCDLADRFYEALRWVGGLVGIPRDPSGNSPAAAFPATRAGQALACRMRETVLAAAAVLRTDAEVDGRLRRLEARAPAAAEAEREASRDDSSAGRLGQHPPPAQPAEDAFERDSGPDGRAGCAGAEAWEGGQAGCGLLPCNSGVDAGDASSNDPWTH